MSGGLEIPLRSLLFAPGSDPRKLGKALASEADVVVADLEDAVAPGAKADARASIADAFAAAGRRPGRMIRVNAPGSRWIDDDLALAVDLGAAAIVVPKALPDAVAAIAGAVGGTPIVAIVETAQALRQAYEIASVPGVEALMFGAVDLAAEIAFRPVPEGTHLLYARSKAVVDCAAAGIGAPIDSAYPHLDDAGYRAEAELARTLGFRGKCCIHPRQLPLAHAVFSPAPDELAWAHRTLEAYRAAEAAGSGVLAVGAEMVDLATVRRAERIVREAGAGAQPRHRNEGTRA